ncbi:hypothetical protein [Pseudobacteriovorax antillogorgiicola]|uniref:Uncharacterized protein n=1 Tax=Pseudobacteriovorax antillogorgiicola TaxID=1513793 RepID=A0A1Y6CNK0_9BACT|nr:hypothetical protein [Pseudobacteriovorax antillogorgiicola]TCS44776.1 hypothetical protein EDD56_1315 [Pseudobacteriovorax antillogorgiicola]SMF77541.1 hypothetical protein SAMN06296036_13159 [Pseudobacteriovorax antillogorgiicola]
MALTDGDSPMAQWLDKLMSRQTALDAVEAFVPKAGQTYRDKRNYDLGVDQNIYVSHISPFLRHRIISEPEVVRAVLHEHSYQESEKFPKKFVGILTGKDGWSIDRRFGAKVSPHWRGA